MSRLRTWILGVMVAAAMPLMGAVQNADDTNFKDVVSQGVTVVDLYADWCGPCKAFGPTFDRVSSQFDGKVKFVKVNIDKSPALTRQYNVASIPTVLLFKDGKEVNRKQGAFNDEQLKGFVQAAMPRS